MRHSKRSCRIAYFHPRRRAHVLAFEIDKDEAAEGEGFDAFHIPVP